MTKQAALERLLDGLSRPEAYPHRTEGVRSIQTHISAVFLAGPYTYKIKKPVQFDFVDFSTLDRRRRFCHAEVRLNRRLAPSIYHGVVPIVEGPQGPRILDVVLDEPSDAIPGESGPEVVEYAVRMDRLPQERTLKSLLRSGELNGRRAAAFLDRLARLLADFHARAERNAKISTVGDFPSIAAKAGADLDEMDELVGETLSGVVLERLRDASERTLSRLRPLMERRAREDVPCDTHGDLRLGHVYHLDGGSADGRIVVIDCVEFNDRFRYADPVADIAFLAMELEFEHRPDLARTFTAGDDAIPEPDRRKAAGRARRHFLRALGRLAPPDQRPALLLLAGLPGVGKSTLARALSENAGFEWIDTDRVRKRIAEDPGRRPDTRHGDTAGRGAAGFEEGIYAPEWTERTYAECLRQAESALFRGARVVLEGSFQAERHRTPFVESARALGVPALLLVCEAGRDAVRRRLPARSQRPSTDDASDAGWEVYQEMARRWEELGPATAAAAHRIRCDGPVEQVLDRARRILRRNELGS